MKKQCSLLNPSVLRIPINMDRKEEFSRYRSLYGMQSREINPDLMFMLGINC